MVSVMFGITPKKTHHEAVAYTHECGYVNPGDDFSSNLDEVTCKACIEMLSIELEPEYKTFTFIVEIESETEVTPVELVGAIRLKPGWNGALVKRRGN